MRKEQVDNINSHKLQQVEDKASIKKTIIETLEVILVLNSIGPEQANVA